MYFIRYFDKRPLMKRKQVDSDYSSCHCSLSLLFLLILYGPSFHFNSINGQSQYTDSMIFGCISQMRLKYYKDPKSIRITFLWWCRSKKQKNGTTVLKSAAFLCIVLLWRRQEVFFQCGKQIDWFCQIKNF